MLDTHNIEKYWYHNKLSKYCCRLTKPRQVILDVLCHTEKHLSAKQLYEAVSKISPAIGLATIYRNLELLVHIGLVSKFDIGCSLAMYEIAKDFENNHHHHLICKRCNSIIDYSNSIDNEKDFLEKREKNLSRKYNFKIEDHCVDFFGICNNCRQDKQHK